MSDKDEKLFNCDFQCDFLCSFSLSWTFFLLSLPIRCAPIQLSFIIVDDVAAEMLPFYHHLIYYSNYTTDDGKEKNGKLPSSHFTLLFYSIFPERNIFISWYDENIELEWRGREHQNRKLNLRGAKQSMNCTHSNPMKVNWRVRIIVWRNLKCDYKTFKWKQMQCLLDR